MSEQLRVSLAYGVLLAAMALAINLAREAPSPMPGIEASEAREERGPRPDGPAEYLEWRSLSWRDEAGQIAENGLMDAKAHADAMRSLGEPPSLAGISRGSWTSIGPGNVGGRVRALAIDPGNPNHLLVGGVAGGIWRSTNGGGSWTPVDDFMANLAVSTLVMTPGSPGVIYAGTGEGYYNADGIRGAGIFKSVDGGSTWTQLPATSSAPAAGQSATDYQYVNRIAISPNAATILAATRSGIFRSVNGGASWTRSTLVGGGAIAVGLGITDVDFSPADPARAVAATYAGTALFSLDGGATWSAAGGMPGAGPSFGTRVEMAFAPSNGAVVYASVDIDAGSIYKSTNGGQTYVEVFDGAADTTLNPLGTQGWYDNLLFVSPTDESFVVWGGIDLFRSTTGGTAFTRFSAWQYQSLSGATSAHADHHIAVAHPGFNGTTNRIVFVGNDGGVYRADDVATAGNNPPSMTNGWVELNNGFGVTQYYGGAGHAATGRITGGTQDNGTLFFNPAVASAPENWTRPFGGDGGFSAYDPTDANYFYGEYVYLTLHRNTTGGASGSGNIYNTNPDTARRLTDAGNSSETEFIAAFVLDPNDPNRLLGAARRLWRSPDVKAATPSWEILKAAPTVAPTNDKISAIAVAPGNADIIYVAHNSGRLYKTVNGTAAAATVQGSWTTLDDNGAVNPLPNRRITRITVDPTNINIVYVTMGGFSTPNVWKSVNGGASWSSAAGSGLTGLPAAPVRDVEVHPTNGNWLYAGTEVGIFTSEDGGVSWGLPHDGPTNASVDELFFMGTTLVAVTHGRGMFSTPTSLVSVVQPPTGLHVDSVVGNRVTLRWTAPPAGTPPTGYVLRGGVNPGEVAASIPTGSVDPLFTFDAPTGAFFIRMHTSAGSALSGPSNEVPLVVNVPLPPSPPSGLLAVVSGSTLGMSWRNTFQGGAATGLALDVTGAVTTSLPLGLAETFSFAGVPSGTYTLSLRATNAGGASPPSNSVTLTFPGPCSGAPQPPADFLATKAGNVITVRWNPPAGGTAATSYVLNVSGAFVGSIPTGGRSLFGAVGNGSYTLSVVAMNACGASAGTAPVTVTVP
jgi:hypothetical protein